MFFSTGVCGENDAIFGGMVNDGSLKMAEYDVNSSEMSSLGTLRVGAKTMLTVSCFSIVDNRWVNNETYYSAHSSYSCQPSQPHRSGNGSM